MTTRMRIFSLLASAVAASMIGGCPAQRAQGPGSTGLVRGADGDRDGDAKGKGAGSGDGADGEKEKKKKRKKKKKSEAGKGPGDETIASDDDAGEEVPSPDTALPPPPPPSSSRREALPGLDLSDAQREALISPRLASARRHLVASDHDHAIAEARAALDIDNDNIAAILLLAQAYFEKGWLSKAEQILTVASQYPDGQRDAKVWMLLGLVYEAEGKSGTVVREAYLKATRLKPNYVKAWNNLGAINIAMADYEAAIAACETALSIDSNSVIALTNVGTAYRRRAYVVKGGERREELQRKAEKAYRAAIALDAKHAPAYLNLGLLFLDSDPFPGMNTLQRLQTAVSYLREFKRLGWSDGAAVSATAIDSYLDSAQKQVDWFVRSEDKEAPRRRRR